MRFVFPDHLIDLNRVAELSYVRENRAGIEIGAMTRQRELELSSLIHQRCPLMTEALRQVGHRQTRNRGRITSYNVCYTKLLRLIPAALGDDVGGQRLLAHIELAVAKHAAMSVCAIAITRGLVEADLEGPQLNPARRLHRIHEERNVVITSYSIHYTKLYENRLTRHLGPSQHRTPKSF